MNDNVKYLHELPNDADFTWFGYQGDYQREDLPTKALRVADYTKDEVTGVVVDGDEVWVTDEKAPYLNNSLYERIVPMPPKYHVYTRRMCHRGEDFISCNTLQSVRRAIAQDIRTYCDNGKREYSRWEAIYSLRASMLKPGEEIKVGCFVNPESRNAGFYLCIFRNW